MRCRAWLFSQLAKTDPYSYMYVYLWHMYEIWMHRSIPAWSTWYLYNEIIYNYKNRFVFVVYKIDWWWVWGANESRRKQKKHFSNESIQIYNCSCLIKFRSMNKVQAPLKPHQPVWSTRIVTITLAPFIKKKNISNFSNICWCFCYCRYLCMKSIYK